MYRLHTFGNLRKGGIAAVWQQSAQSWYFCKLLRTLTESNLITGKLQCNFKSWDTFCRLFIERAVACCSWLIIGHCCKKCKKWKQFAYFLKPWHLWKGKWQTVNLANLVNCKSSFWCSTTNSAKSGFGCLGQGFKESLNPAIELTSRVNIALSICE